MKRGATVWYMAALASLKIRTLKELRKEAGVSQQALAEKLNIHRTTLNRYEKGKLKPKKSLLCMAACVMGFQPGEIEGYMERVEVK